MNYLKGQRKTLASNSLLHKGLTRLGRFELLTLRSAIWCSIQLSYNLIKTTMPDYLTWSFAEWRGFEPRIPLPVYFLSREAPSTARPSLQFSSHIVGGIRLNQYPTCWTPRPQCKLGRMERDSNPRRLAPQRFSRPPPSTTRPSIQ